MKRQHSFFMNYEHCLQITTNTVRMIANANEEYLQMSANDCK